MAKVTGHIQISAELLDTDDYIIKEISKAISKEIGTRLNKISISILDSTKILLDATLRQQPEYNSIAMQGKLAKALGLPDGEDSMNWLIEQIIANIKIDIVHNTATPKMAYTDFSIKSTLDVESLYNDPQANVETKAGETLPWLRWLLSEGSNQVIKGYRIYYAPIPKPRSRSGGAIMVQDEGSSWGVPPEFAGTESNNFITRAIIQVQNELGSAISDKLKGALS